MGRIKGRKERNYRELLVDKNQHNLLDKPGVYKIGFKNTQNFYIGSTTESIKRRIGKHLMQLERQIHCNSILQAAFSKYKEMTLEVLEECYGESCVSKEQHWIDILNPVYNICKYAGNTLGIKMSKHIVEMHSKKVDMFDKKGNYIRTFVSIAEASRITNINTSSIRQAIKKGFMASKYQFRYAGKMTKLPYYRKATSHRILCYNLDGQFIKEYDSILEAAIELNISTGNISRNLTEEVKTAQNYLFKKYTKDFPIKISPYKRTHSFQKRAIITNLETKEVLMFDSLRQIPTHICHRNTLVAKQKKAGNIFVIKNKYQVQIKTYNSNEAVVT